MKFKNRMIVGCVVGSAALVGALVCAAGAGAQERTAAVAVRQGVAAPRPAAYEVTRESVVQGTVVNYTEKSELAPIGAHVTVQTASGTVDVHLGPGSYLRSNHFSLAAGDSVKFAGVMTATKNESVFLARVAQNGNQSIVVRSPRGFLLASNAARASRQAEGAQKTQQGRAR